MFSPRGYVSLFAMESSLQTKKYADVIIPRGVENNGELFRQICTLYHESLSPCSGH